MLMGQQSRVVVMILTAETNQVSAACHCNSLSFWEACHVLLILYSEIIVDNNYWYKFHHLFIFTKNYQY